jgi:hypothetical protein
VRSWHTPAKAYDKGGAVTTHEKPSLGIEGRHSFAFLTSKALFYLSDVLLKVYLLFVAALGRNEINSSDRK